MNKHCYFVTGTDTDVGKTFVSAALLSRARRKGYSTAAYKPVAAGAEISQQGLRNDDALALMQAANSELNYHDTNPICFESAIAPHIAALDEKVELTVDAIIKQSGPFFAANADFALIEGAGGWRVPLNNHQTLADFARFLDYPVIVVVAMRLGCLSHALLTIEAIVRDGLRVAGWVANTPIDDAMPRYDENVATLESWIDAPLLGRVSFCAGAGYKVAAESIRLPDGLE